MTIISFLRTVNRKKNYALKELRLKIARLLLDYKCHVDFDARKVKKILFLRDDNKIGDMIVSTAAFREMAKAGYEVSVLSGQYNQCIIEHNEYIHKVYTYRSSKYENIKLALLLRKENFDLVIDVGDRITSFYFLFIKLINTKHLLGFNKEKFRSYDLSIPYKEYDKHITNRYQILLSKIGITDASVKYNISIPESITEDVAKYISKLPFKKYIVINPFTTNPNRDMSLAQINAIVEWVKKERGNYGVFIVGVPERIATLNIDGTNMLPFYSILHCAELIKTATLVISPDTSIVHLAAAFNKPLISLYGHDIHDNFINNKVWAPGYANAVLIFSDTKFESISSIPAQRIISEIKITI